MQKIFTGFSAINAPFLKVSSWFPFETVPSGYIYKGAMLVFSMSSSLDLIFAKM